MILADPYHQISPSLEWHGDGASYPFLNPSNFVEYPTIYNLSRPHLPYIAQYPQDPSIQLDFSCQHHHPFRLDLREYMCYKTWMEKQLNLYAAWDHFVRDINLHVSPIHIGNPLNDFNHTYMPHLDSHLDDPSILEAIPDAKELRRMMEDDYIPSGVVKPMSKERMIGNTSLEESGLSECMDVDIVLYQPCPSTLVHPSSPAPQVPRCTGSSIQPGSKHCRDDLSSSPKQSKELTLCQRLGLPVDIQASQPLWGGSLISWMTEQPPHMSHSSARPGPPLLPLSPPQSHIPTHPHSPCPYLPSCCCSPSSCGYHHHSPLPSSCGPHYHSPLPCYCSPSSHYHSPSPQYRSPSPCYCSPLPHRHHYHPPPPQGAHHCSPSPCRPHHSLPSPRRPSHHSPSPHEPLHFPPSPHGPHCSPSLAHALSRHPL